MSVQFLILNDSPIDVYIERMDAHSQWSVVHRVKSHTHYKTKTLMAGTCIQLTPASDGGVQYAKYTLSDIPPFDDNTVSNGDLIVFRGHDNVTLIRDYEHIGHTDNDTDPLQTRRTPLTSLTAQQGIPIPSEATTQGASDTDDTKSSGKPGKPFYLHSWFIILCAGAILLLISGVWARFNNK